MTAQYQGGPFIPSWLNKMTCSRFGALFCQFTCVKKLNITRMYAPRNSSPSSQATTFYEHEISRGYCRGNTAFLFC